MKKLILIGAMSLMAMTPVTTTNQSVKTEVYASYSVLCEGINRDGGKVKLINHQGKNYIIYYDRNDCQIGASIQTAMQVKDFTLWMQPLGYMPAC